MKKAIRFKNKKRITILYIPENESSTKTIRIANWIPKFIITSLALTFVYAASYTIAYKNLRIEHESSICSIKNITAINHSQRIEIEELEENANKIKVQLYENIAMLQELKEAVGIESNSHAAVSLPNTSTPDNSTNLYPYTPIQSIIKTNNTNYTDHIYELKTSFVSLSKEAKSQKSEIDNSIGPIKDRLSFLKAKPSIMPVKGKITAAYGYRKNPFTGRGSEFHKGVDIAAKHGTSVVATADGIVTYAAWKSGYGNMVIISHGYGFNTVYAHNSAITTKVGEKVKRGQVISKVGSTGRSTAPHLHYEIKLNGKNVDPSRYF